jgi:hypothetical protein
LNFGLAENMVIEGRLSLAPGIGRLLQRWGRATRIVRRVRGDDR